MLSVGSCPFQFVVGSGVSIEVMDCRMPSQPLLSWAQPVAAGDAPSEFGAIEEIDVAAHARESRGARHQPLVIACLDLFDSRYRLSLSLVMP